MTLVRIDGWGGIPAEAEAHHATLVGSGPYSEGERQDIDALAGLLRRAVAHGVRVERARAEGGFPAPNIEDIESGAATHAQIGWETL